MITIAHIISCTTTKDIPMSIDLAPKLITTRLGVLRQAPPRYGCVQYRVVPA